MSSAATTRGRNSRAVDTGNTFVGDVRVNAKRWLWKAVRNPTAVVLEVLTATFSILLFTAVFGEVGGMALEQAGFGDVEYVSFLLPAVFVQATIGGAFTAGIGLVNDLDSGMFEKAVASPMSWTAVFTGKALADLVRLLVPLVLVLVVSLPLGATVETGVIGVVGILLVCVLLGLAFMALSNVVGLVTRDEETVNAATMLVMFPLLFLSPAFLPVSALSPTVELLATINPVTYGVDAIRALVLGRDVMTVVEITTFGGMYDTLVPALAVLVGLDLILGALSIRALARASSASVD